LQPAVNPALHLTYCTKVHPGHGWDTIFPSLQRCVPELKDRICPTAPFGLGLRLSAAESETLAAPDRLAEFQDFLAAHNLYVFTLNGFPYGAFHGPRVKADVFAPDWRYLSRLSYTIRLAEILAKLLPAGMAGGISTLPLSYKPWISQRKEEALIRVTRNLILIIKELLAIKDRGGPSIHVDLEPEPDGLVENTRELVEYYQEWLLSYGVRLLADMAGLAPDRAREALLEHLQVCLDTCHMAVAYEDPQESLQLLADNGIRVGKVQITNGWRLRLDSERGRRQQLARELTPFTASPYLHQVVGRRQKGVWVRYRDLEEALADLKQASEREWRIHYHLPVFVERFGNLESTQDVTREVLQLLGSGNVTEHLELETYTWELLPADLKIDLVDSLEREYRWVLDILAQDQNSSGEKLLGQQT
jgi:sugar phosphate isomerase/epimerase